LPARRRRAALGRDFRSPTEQSYLLAVDTLPKNYLEFIFTQFGDFREGCACRTAQIVLESIHLPLWACSSARSAPALQVSRANHTSAASGVAYAEPCRATNLLNWTDVGPIWPVWSWRLRMSGAGLHFSGKEYPLRRAILKVYTPAKTLAACFKFRNKIGLDLALEALRECRHLKKPSIDELWPGIETEGRSIGSTERVEHVHHYLSADSPYHASRPA
jgi:hypothetical protein